MTPLEIIAALEAGQKPKYSGADIEALSNSMDSDASNNWTANTIVAAIHGDLNACAALQERVLPGWTPSLNGPGEAVLYGPFIDGRADLEYAEAPTLAAAWLAAILKAHMAKETT